MIELQDDRLVFSFPEVHPRARLSISFQRTLRIPDDGKDHPLPPGLGRFPVRHVDDASALAPEAWQTHGGVVLPMYSAEAMWLSFESADDEERDTSYPFAVQIATGKVNAVTGGPWREGLGGAPQDYMVVPTQPWLDGFCVEKGVVRQFVAMPLGAGYTAEEQITGEAAHGGLQISVRPMRREIYERRFPPVPARERFSHVCACCAPASSPDMGLGAGGRMRQEIYDDPYSLEDWEAERHARCFVHLVGALVWAGLSGEQPPAPPMSAWDYEQRGLPWFDWYDPHHEALAAQEVLAKLKSIRAIGAEKGDVPLPENMSVSPARVVPLGPEERPRRVREMTA